MDRRVKLTQTFAANLAARFACPGRCVYPASATDLQHEHFMDRLALESLPPSAFAADGSFHADRPAETLADSMIERQLRLTASCKLRHDVHDPPWFPGESSLLGPADP